MLTNSGGRVAAASPRRHRLLPGLLALVVAVLVVAAGVWTLTSPRDERVRVTAEFATVDGVFEGTQVRILGIVVGTVEAVEPAGEVMRVGMSVDPGTELPDDVGAVVMNPAVIADRFVELTPAYSGGPTLPADGVIPVERTRSPLDFDAFLTSLDTLSSAFAPDSEAAGRALDRSAGLLAERGDELNSSIADLSTVTNVVGNRSGDIEDVIGELSVLMTAAGGRDETLRELVTGMADLGEQIRDDGLDVEGTTESLRTVLDEVDRLLESRGEDVTATTGATRETVAMYAEHREDLAEFLDLYPLMMENLTRSIGPDGRARIRLDISTNISQFARGREFCEQNPMPMCVGAGLTNPLMFPVEADDPLGLGAHLDAATGGGR